MICFRIIQPEMEEMQQRWGVEGQWNEISQTLIADAGWQVHRDWLNLFYFSMFLKFPRINTVFLVVKQSTLKTDYFLNLFPLLKNHKQFNIVGRLIVTNYLRVKMYFAIWGLLHVPEHQNQQVCLLRRPKYSWDPPQTSLNQGSQLWNLGICDFKSTYVNFPSDSDAPSLESKKQNDEQCWPQSTYSLWNMNCLQCA